MVDSGTIASVLDSATSAKKACHNLVRQALKNGGRDNVTVVLAYYRIPQATDAALQRLLSLRSIASWWRSVLRQIFAAMRMGD
jgi:serine/threonine protein phosphatase PrpC